MEGGEDNVTLIKIINKLIGIKTVIDINEIII